MMVANRYRTQIIYNEWNIPPQAGRVCRFEGGFEFSMRRSLYFLCPWWPLPKKVIRDDQVRAITHWPGRRGPGWIIIGFDSDDEIMLLDQVLADIDMSSVQYPVLGGFDHDSSGTRLMALKFRQRQLGPVSWENGRLSLEGTTSRGAVLRKRICMVVAASFLVLAILL
jgi:hypothetical protein